MRARTLTTLLVAALCFPLVARAAAGKMVVVAENETGMARPAETIAVPWAEIAKRFPSALPSHISVCESHGPAIPHQLINPKPEEHRDNYESIIFQHDFKAGKRTATFDIIVGEIPEFPYPSKVMARHVPERFDDFAWENDRIAHRMYGPALETEAAGKDAMAGSGIDVWAKKVPYPIVDRWYLMGHYHEDSGEGQDMYEVGQTRGCGGTGIWDGKNLAVSRNWKSCRVLANGPVRAEFELAYEPWDTGSGVKVSETKRIRLDAGQNFNVVESTFKVEGAETATIAAGIAKHTKRVLGAKLARDGKDGWMSVWEDYGKDGNLGTAVILPGATGFAEDAKNNLVLAQAKSGQPLRYYVGAGYDRAGHFPDQAAWERYVKDFATRLKSPIKLSYPDAK